MSGARLIQAIENKNLEQILSLLEDKADVHATNVHGKSAYDLLSDMLIPFRWANRNEHQSHIPFLGFLRLRPIEKALLDYFDNNHEQFLNQNQFNIFSN